MNIPVITPLFGVVIGWMYEHLCFQNYMLTLVLFALFIKLILFPFGIKQQKNTLKQAKLRPMEMAIRKKYAGRNDRATQEKLNNELMQLYQQENFNPASGCRRFSFKCRSCSAFTALSSIRSAIFRSLEAMW